MGDGPGRAAVKQPLPNKLASIVSGAVKVLSSCALLTGFRAMPTNLGSLSGVIISACVQPLDVLRTRMQGEAAKGVSHGTLVTLRLVLDQYGVRGLWRGTSPTVLRLGMGAGLHFCFLDSIKAALEQRHPDGKLTSTDAFIAGGLSRAGAAIISCPVTVVKTRMEYGGSGGIQYKGVVDAFRSIARKESPAGLFRGLGPTVLTNAPFSALYYMFYKQLQTRLTKEGRPSVAVNFASGTIAAVAATVLTQPTDVIRTRMQLGFADSGSGAAGVLRSVLARDGASALMAGVAPRVLKRTLQTALVWTLYEELYPQLTKLSTRLASVRKQQQDRRGADG